MGDRSSNLGFACGSDGNLPATRGTWVRSLGSEDPLEEGMATHSSTLAMDRGSLAGYNPWGLKDLVRTERLSRAYAQL